MSTFFEIIIPCTGCVGSFIEEFRTTEVLQFERWFELKRDTNVCNDCWDRLFEEVDRCRKHLELEKSEEHPQGYFGACRLGYEHTGVCEPYGYHIPTTPEEIQESRELGERIDREYRASLLPDELERLDALLPPWLRPTKT